MARLIRGEQRLGFSEQNKNDLYDEVCHLAQGTARAVVKLILTRGAGGRGYRPPASAKTTRIISLHEWPDYPPRWYTTGITLRVCRTRIGRSVVLAGLKHLNRLEQVLARHEWDDPEIPEGLMLDENDHVVEATQANLFLIKSGVLYTPSLENSGVAGIVRELVLEIATDLGIETVKTELELSDIKQGEALFITNSLLGICPVAALQEQTYDILQIPTTLTDRIQQRCFGSGLAHIGTDDQGLLRPC